MALAINILESRRKFVNSFTSPQKQGGTGIPDRLRIEKAVLVGTYIPQFQSQIKLKIGLKLSVFSGRNLTMFHDWSQFLENWGRGKRLKN